MVLAAQAGLAQTAPTIEVFPREVHLEGGRDIQTLVVMARTAAGETQDLTAQAQIALENPALAMVQGTRLNPKADGATNAKVTVNGATLNVPVTVANMAAPRAVDFKLDVMPVFTKSGCNTGACHGSARGQDGFHLSLFGYDPAGDFEAITRQLPGRRVNLALPEQSLVLTKGTGTVTHTGGQRFNNQDARYQDLADWIRNGAPRDPDNTPSITGVEFFPQDLVLRGPHATQQLGVRATYSDGTDRDVTRLSVYLSNNDGSARVDDAGLLTCGQPGEALLMARFGPFTVGTQAIVLPADAPADCDTGPAVNYVDVCVNAKLRKLRLKPAPLCGDEEFLRRAYLDLAGILPTPEEYAAFMARGTAERRTQLIDELLQRKSFAELWVMKWAERLQIRSTNEVSYKAMLLYYDWLQERLMAGAPINTIVHDLLAASGGTFTQPPTNFYQLETDPMKLTENVAQAFLGVRIQCAQCHNHPFDRWTMDDYYGFAAFFAQIGRKPGEDPRETIVFNSGGGDTRHPVGGRVMAPKFLGGPTPDLAGRDRREVLADWLTSKDNRMFARNVANFTWAQFFARGIIEPADDARVSNPPANAALLDALADHLVAYNFDLRQIVRDICLSNAYQRAVTGGPTDTQDLRNFSHAQLRRIRAECLLDCIGAVTHTSEKYRGLPLGARAVEISDGNTSNYFLTTFGRAKRDTVCTCQVVMEPSLSQALHLLNGETVHARIESGCVVKKMLADKKTLGEIIEQLYLATLTRKPTAAELEALKPLLSGGEPQALLNDLFWSLLNSREFIFNH